MKRLSLLLLLLGLLLCACRGQETATVFTVEKDGYTLTIDKNNGTITDDSNTYQFHISRSVNAVDTTITYPDGSSYWWSDRSAEGAIVGSGGWSDDYDEYRYIPGDILVNALDVEPESNESNLGTIVLALICMAVGVWQAAAPYSAWFVSRGWMFRDAEPSNLALAVHRIGGVICMILGVFALIAAFMEGI